MSATDQHSGLPFAATSSSSCLIIDTPSNTLRFTKQSSNAPRQSPLSQYERPRPGRRRYSHSASSVRYSTKLPFYLTALLLVLACSCTVTAMQGKNEVDRLIKLTLDDLARSGEILVDLTPPPNMRELHKRDRNSSTTVNVPTATTSAGSKASTTTITSAQPTGTGIVTDNTGFNGNLPTPFDSSLGANFTTASCPNFFQTFLSNDTFKSCLPFSLLLQNSVSFFQAEKSIVRVTQTLDATCSVKLNTCVDLMQILARNLRLDANCGQDFVAQNPNVLQAYQGFLAYEPLFRAGCLKSSSGSYCFADAITNSSSPSDSYVYFLPLGVSLPGGARPTCNTCLQNTMAVFSTFAGNASQPLSTDYVPAAQQINIGCGPTFVNTTVPMVSASHSLQAPPILSLFLSALLLLSTVTYLI